MTYGAMIPLLRYADAPAAIEWLCTAFGFQEHVVVPGPPGVIIHAQLTLGSGMVMVGTHRDEDGLKSPRDVGGVTQAVSVVVEEIDAHYERACAAGAQVVVPIMDPPFGGRFYTAEDPEGHRWSFGSYDPWAPPPQ
jgi:uncharacterized glyoxalase superfamily protein PhnB